MALVAGSPALDISPRGAVFDQRGLERPQGSGFDAGSFELMQATVVGDFLGFEDDSRPWEATQAELVISDKVTEGRQSLAVQACGYNYISSPVFSTLELTTGSTLTVDIFVPNSAFVHWAGGLQLFFSIPSAGIYNQYAGWRGLTELPFGAYSSLSYNVPQQVVQAMDTEHNDARIHFSLNTLTCDPPYLLDNVRLSD